MLYHSKYERQKRKMTPQRQLFSSCIVVVLVFSISISLCYGGGTLPGSKPRTSRGIGSRRLPLHKGGSKRPLSPPPIRVDVFGGAKGDNLTDDTKAFERAWEKACSSNGKVVLLVPPHKSYRVKQITFSGAQCKSHLTMQIHGTIMAFGELSDYHFPINSKLHYWLTFESVQNLVVEGPGTINGNGDKWWQSSCKQNNKTHKPVPNCNNDAPTAVTFKKCNNLMVNNLNFEKAQRKHVSFENCTNVKAFDIRVNAPEGSPNTDGIHVTETKNIHISNSRISTGDDCISIISGSQNVQATNVTCGPGHGISIGSLGKNGSEDHVSDVTVTGARLNGTMYGVRIKTWPGGSGYATNITFQNIQMDNVTNPIIIDQNYCDTATKVINGECKPPLLQGDRRNKTVKVHNVTYRDITGTVAKGGEAIKFDCSKTVRDGCDKIMLENIKLDRGGAVVLSNVGKLTCEGLVFPNLNQCRNNKQLAL